MSEQSESCRSLSDARGRNCEADDERKWNLIRGCHQVFVKFSARKYRHLFSKVSSFMWLLHHIHITFFGMLSPRPSDVLLTNSFQLILFIFFCARRYLSDLHAPGDPAWQCIYAQHKWILQLMQDCRDEFITGQRGDKTQSLTPSFAHSLMREGERQRESTPAVSHNSTSPLLASLPPSAPSPAKDQSVYFFMNVWIRWKWRSIGCGFGFQDLTCYSTCTHTNSLSHSHATSQMDWNN